MCLLLVRDVINAIQYLELDARLDCVQGMHDQSFDGVRARPAHRNPVPVKAGVDGPFY
jgi:hypothetical protein